MATTMMAWVNDHVRSDRLSSSAAFCLNVAISDSSDAIFPCNSLISDRKISVVSREKVDRSSSCVLS